MSSSPNRRSDFRFIVGGRKAEIFAEINGWWRENAKAGRASVVQAYGLGKAQRILKHLEPVHTGPIVLPWGFVEALNRRSIVIVARQRLAANIHAGRWVG